ncbi:hypothetical protein [Cognatiyoonia koreensis]|nr:hypothetical protein [Cognatiyoonia koreensis]
MLFALFATTADATCRIQTTLGSCQTPPRSPKPPAAGLGPAPIEIGTILERGEYSIVLNSQWYGLPRPKDGWVYFRIQDDVYRVDYETREVLERATREANQNWP